MGLCSPSVLLDYKGNLLVKQLFSDFPPIALQLVLKSFGL